MVSPKYFYEIGYTYTSKCDCNIDIENSFGLSAYTKEGALKYHNTGKLMKIKVHLDDLGCIVHKGHKLRCKKIEIIEQVI